MRKVLYLYAYVGWVKVAEEEGVRNEYEILFTHHPFEAECGLMSAKAELRPLVFRFSRRYRRAVSVRLTGLLRGRWLDQESVRPYPYR